MPATLWCYIERYPWVCDLNASKIVSPKLDFFLFPHPQVYSDTRYLNKKDAEKNDETTPLLPEHLRAVSIVQEALQDSSVRWIPRSELTIGTKQTNKQIEAILFQQLLMYISGSRIGIGGYGEVYRGMYNKTQVAIKRLYQIPNPSENTSDPSKTASSNGDSTKMIREFVKECRMLSRLRFFICLLLLCVVCVVCVFDIWCLCLFVASCNCIV